MTPEDRAKQTLERVKLGILPSMEAAIARAIREDRQESPCPVVLDVAEASKDMCPRCVAILKRAVES